MSSYYNEIDPYAAQWLRNLIDAGHIARGVVDTRSIEDVHPRDLDGFAQCHFFAGIGVWSYALRLAGWPDDRPVWTGSCPCQPFSSAGEGAGFDDERHLWPHFHWLIQERRPAIVVGEQVASKDAEPWLDLVRDDMEGLAYAFGAVAFPSAGIGAPHIRDRTYWVANAAGQAAERAGIHPGRLADAERQRVRPCGQGGADGEAGSLQGIDREWQRLRPDAGSGDDGMGARPGPTNGFWRDADWLACRDDRWRPVEPGTFPLAHWAPARVGRLRAYGNAINAQAASEFVRAAT